MEFIKKAKETTTTAIAKPKKSSAISSQTQRPAPPAASTLLLPAIPAWNFQQNLLIPNFEDEDEADLEREEIIEIEKAVDSILFNEELEMLELDMLP